MKNYSIILNNKDDKYYVTKEINNQINIIGSIDNITDTYKYIIYDLQILNDHNYSEINKKEYFSILMVIQNLFKILSIGGTFFISVYNFCITQIIEIIYILSFMFDYCTIYNGIFIVAIYFSPVIKLSDINKMLNINVSIEPKYKLTELVTYLEDNLKYHIKKNILLLKNKEDKFLKYIMDDIILSFKYLNYDTTKLMIEYNKSMIETFKRITINNKLIKISSAINYNEATYLSNIIKKYKDRKAHV